MTSADIQNHLDRYLELRRAPGFEIRIEGRLLRDFPAFLQGRTLAGCPAHAVHLYGGADRRPHKRSARRTARRRPACPAVSERTSRAASPYSDWRQHLQ